MTKVKELIEELAKQSPDSDVVFIPETDSIPRIVYEVEGIIERDGVTRIYLEYLDQE